MKNLGMPARHEDALKTPLKSQRFAPDFFDLDNQDQEQLKNQEQERLQEKAEQRESIRAEYLATRLTHPNWAKRMENSRELRSYIEDLIEDQAA